MFVSYRWLARHVDLSGISPEQLAEDLTLSTAEVEGVEPFLPHMANVTVGHVLGREPHPDADKLSVCRVDVGEGEPLQIVCGAPNVDGGQRVAVATVGTRLGELKIKKAKIRGVESRGMICSERELGLGEEHDGIWVLPADAEIGRPVGAAVGLEDWIIEIDNKSLTHRPDLWGHRGIAREVAAIYKRELLPLATTLPVPRAQAGAFPVRIDSTACSRYLALVLGGVQNGGSPDWLRHLLLAVGQRPLDLLVDISNFVMLDLGQPNHLFDRARLSPEGIAVRNARAGERMTTLDEKERELVESDLLICSGDHPVALAGIMGGEESKVIGQTDELLLEVAHFDPVVVRRTSARLGLRTDASVRFEKSLDPSLPLAAAGHLVQLLTAMQPDVYLAAPLTDAGDWSDPSLTIELRPSRVRICLGDALTDEAQVDILRRLELDVDEGQSEDVLRVRVPSFRATRDVTIEQDLIEEIGRIWRYASIPEAPLIGHIFPAVHDERRALVRRIEDQLAGGAHFHQTISHSFLTDELLDKLGERDLPYVEVVNPVAEGFSKLRRSVVPSLLGLLEGARRQRESVRLFELGKGYVPTGGDPGAEPAEHHELALALALAPEEDVPFDRGALPRLKGVLVDLLRQLAIETGGWQQARPEDGLPAWAHPGRSARLALGGDDGAVLLAPIEPGLARALGLSGELASDVALARVSMDALVAARESGPEVVRYRPLARFPGIKLDVALALPDEVSADGARAAIERAAKGLAAEVTLFDVYTGESLGPGRRSLAWHVLLQAPDRTLGDTEEQKFLDRLGRLTADLGGELRRE